MDFEEVFQNINKDSFVYLDPPYDPVSDTASFTGHDKGGFDRKEQLRLKKVCDKLDKEGARFLLSDSGTGFILDLYKDYNIEFVRAERAVNSKPDRRGEINEVLIRNYE